MSSTTKGGSSMTPSPPINSELLFGQRLSGMRAASSLSEWQLQAVLFKSKLTQYFDIFISQGGDDIDQIMQCDEHEFLEIMSLVGMASKPLHVRRLQRTLNEFSLNRAQFLMSAVPFIGFPPMEPTNASSSSSENLAAALQFLVSGFMSDGVAAFPTSCTDFSSATSSSGFNSSKSDNFSPLCGPGSGTTLANSTSSYASIPSTCSATSTASAAVSTTVNVLPFPDGVLMSLVDATRSVGSTSGFTSLIDTTAAATAVAASVDSPLSLSYLPRFTATSTAPIDETGIGQFDEQIPSTSTASIRMTNDAQGEMNSTLKDQPFEMPSLTADEIARLAQFARSLCESTPSIEPRFVQNKKRISKELLDVMSIPSTHSNRIIEFRRFSAIYGRFDAKRKPDKALTFHEALVNEAAAQLCVCRPELLTRRDELFPMARKLVRLAGFFGPRSCYHQRRHSDDSADDGETALKSGEDQSRTTSRSSIITGSASPSSGPSADMTGSHADSDTNVTPIASPRSTVRLVPAGLPSRSLTPEAVMKIGKKRKRASVDL